MLSATFTQSVFGSNEISGLKLPYIKMIPNFHAARYTDVKFGKKRVLVLDWHSVSADDSRYWNRRRKSWHGASPKTFAVPRSTQTYYLI